MNKSTKVLIGLALGAFGIVALVGNIYLNEKVKTHFGMVRRVTPVVRNANFTNIEALDVRLPTGPFQADYSFERYTSSLSPQQVFAALRSTDFNAGYELSDPWEPTNAAERQRLNTVIGRITSLPEPPIPAGGSYFSVIQTRSTWKVECFVWPRPGGGSLIDTIVSIRSILSKPFPKVES